MKKICSIIFGLLFYFVTNAQKIPSWKTEDLTGYYNKKSDSVYVINFWATYCIPCIGEIPYLQNITKKYERQKVKLLLVSLDVADFYPKKIKKFAKANNYSSTIVWLDETDPNRFCQAIDKSWIGSIPATLFVNAATGYKKFIGSAMTEKQYEKELRNAIGRD